MNDLFKRAWATPAPLLFGNSIGEWIAALAVFLGLWSALWILRQLIAARYKRYLGGNNPTAVRVLAHLIGNTKQFFFLAVALAGSGQSLALPPRIQAACANFILILVLLQSGLWAGRALRFYLELKQQERGPDRFFAGSLDVIHLVASVLIWSLLILVALENAGVNITALLAGLGVGGVAIALALQNILGDLFASLSIALDKPFVVGDTLTIDTFTGAVEHIGIKTTRLRSETGEQIILSNADILKSRVRNFGRAQELRTLVTIRVAYSTPGDQLAQIPSLLERIVREQPNARFERCHLKTLGDWALQFELSYFRQSPELHPLLDLQQDVNLRIIDEFRRQNIEFALPVMRVATVN
jgi:small-conductance mechanosensitive channel